MIHAEVLTWLWQSQSESTSSNDAYAMGFLIPKAA